MEGWVYLVSLRRCLAGIAPLFAVSLWLSTGACAVEETCVDCHSYMSKTSQRIVAEWKASIHAKKGVGCSGCHGGDPKNQTIDGAMWYVPGFKGRVDKRDIPAMCAKCHADPNYMRPFNISSTSQYAEYKESVHGKRLLQRGDRKVAVCTDCHGIHDIRATNDVKSWVYKTSIPKTCAKCHADAEYMKPYGIPTNQYDEYKRSWHGRKLLEEQDKAVPACSDCHGTHGATPPGVKEVPDVCGRCHSRTQDYFNQGPHYAALQKLGVPRCVDCHGNHETLRLDDRMLTGSGVGRCGNCHSEGSKGRRTARQLHETILGLAKVYNGAQARIEQAEAANMDMQDQIAELENARTSLVAARALQHTVTLSKVKGTVEEGLVTVRSVDKVSTEALAKSRRRDNSLLAAGIFIVLTSGVLFWKWRLSYERWLRGSNAE